MSQNELGEAEEQKNLRSDLGELEHYGDPRIASYEGSKIPKFLLLTYLTLPIWGLITLVYFWNGSVGWFDRGYWHELQIAANTVNPNQNIYTILENETLEKHEEETDHK